MSLPIYVEVRNRIEKIKDEYRHYKMFLKAAYLLGARGIELAGKLYPSDKSHAEACGPKGTDVCFEKTEQPDPNLQHVIKFLLQIKNGEIKTQQVIESLSSKIEVAVFTVKTVRQEITEDGSPPCRKVAVPLPKDYEPWTSELLDYFKERGNRYVFPFTSNNVWDWLTHKESVFDGMVRYVEEYPYYPNGQFGIDLFSCPRHLRLLKVDFLRQIRILELSNKFGFDSNEIASYAGLKFQPPGVLGKEAYPTSLQDSWKGYIKKLCTYKTNYW